MRTFGKQHSIFTISTGFRFLLKWLLLSITIFEGTVAGAETTNAPQVSVYYVPSDVAVGDSTKLYVTTSNASSCRDANGAVLTLDATGVSSVTIASVTGPVTARITCSNSNGITTRSATLLVNGSNGQSSSSSSGSVAAGGANSSSGGVSDGSISTNEYWLKSLFSPVVSLINKVISSVVSGANGEPATLSLSPMQNSVRVNENGAAVYTVPFSLPDGVGGVKPNVAAIYNSQAANGLLGKGGSLSGLSVIKRCVQTVVRDGVAKPVTWSADDRFCIDDQRLMVVAGTYGSPESQYRTERDIGVVYTAKGGVAGNPDYFVAQASDGAVLTFGGNANAKELGGMAMSWALTQYQDAANNIIEYVYEGSAADGLRISRINYAFLVPNTTLTPSASIEFIYKDRDDVASRYVAGYEFKNTKLLSRVNAYGVLGVLYRSYQFDYATSNGLAGYVSRWQGVDECLSFTACFASTQFSWGTTQVASNGTVELKDISIGWLGTVTSHGYTTTNNNIDVASLTDLNGDGIGDLVWNEPVNDSGNYLTMTFASFDPAILPFESASYIQKADQSNSTNTALIRLFQTADVNASGTASLITGGYVDTNYDILRANSAIALRNKWYWYVDNSSYIPTESNARYPIYADISGDGFTSQIMLGRDLAKVWVSKVQKIAGRTSDMSNYFGLLGNATYKFDDVMAKPAYIYAQMATEAQVPGIVDLAAGDFDGDGRSEIIFNSTWPNYQTSETLHKINVYSFNNGIFNLRNTISQQSYNGIYQDSYNYYPDAYAITNLSAPDINGDGLADVGFRSGGVVKYTLSKGNGSFTGLVSLPTIVGSYYAGKQWYFDVNRDGKADIVRIAYTTSSPVTYNYYVDYWDQKQNKFADPVLLRTTANIPLTVGDANGDGWLDFVEYDLAAKNNSQPYVKIYGFTNTDANVANGYPGVLAQDAIITVKTGLRNVTTIEYQTLVRSNRVQQSTCTSAYKGSSTPCQDLYGTSQYQPLRFDVTIPAGSLDATSVDSKNYYKKTNEPFSALNNPYAETARVTQYVAPLPIVTRIKTTRDTGVSSQVTQADNKYSYSVMRTQAGGRGLLGFEKTTVEDVIGGTRTETTWRQDWPYTGLIVSQNVLTSFGKLLKEQTNTQALDVIDFAGAKVFKPKQQDGVPKTYALKANGAEQGDLIANSSSSSSSSSAPNSALVIANSGSSSSAATQALPPTPMINSVAINNLGAAVYTVPFSLPDGVGGVKPNVAAIYNSQAANGLLGKGGSLSGLSVIKRCVQTVVRDGVAKPITWSADDRFCIDDQRLMVVAGTYGSPESQYRTERDIGVVYTAKGGVAGNPDYFVAQASDGAVLTFGGNANAKELGGMAMSWALTQYQDAANNIIEYVYEGSAADGLRISRINYAFPVPNTTLTPSASIEFIYKDRDDVASRYVAGYEFKNTKLLSRVNAYGVLGVLYRSYQFDYATSSGLAGYVSRWQGVDECLSFTACFASTQFSWGTTQVASNGTVELKDISIGWLGTVTRHGYTTSGVIDTANLSDLNGDGIGDLTWTEPVSDSGSYYNMTFVSFDPAVIPFDSVSYIHRAEQVASPNYMFVKPFQTADINASGTASIIASGYVDNYDYLRANALIAQRDKRYWWVDGTSIPGDSGAKYPIYADISGDGFASQIMLGKDLAKVWVSKVQKIAGRTSDMSNYFGLSGIANFKFDDVMAKPSYIYAQMATESNIPGNVDFAAGDFDGDGRSEIIFNSTWPNYQTSLTLHKINIYSFNNNVFNLKNTVSQETYNGIYTDGYNYFPDAYGVTNLSAPDINGDGLADVSFNKSGSLKYLLSKGNGFTDTVSIPAIVGPYYGGKQWFFDVNRDGKADIVRVAYTTSSPVTYNYYVNYWDQKQNKFADPVLLRTTANIPLTVGDANGDGWLDFVEYDQTAKNNSQPYVKIYGFTNSDTNVTNGYPGVLAQDAIVTAKTGLRNVTTIEYQTLTRPNRVAQSTCVSAIKGPSTPCQDLYGISQYQPLRFDVTLPAGSLDATSVDSKNYYKKTNEPFSALNNPYAETARVTQYVAPLPIVTRIKTTRDTGVSSQVTQADNKYSYSVMRTQAGGRGLLGFEKTAVDDVIGGTKTETTWRQDWPYTGMVAKITKINAQGNTIIEAENSLGLAVADNNGSKVFSPSLLNQTIKTYAAAIAPNESGELLKAVKYSGATLADTSLADGQAALNYGPSQGVPVSVELTSPGESAVLNYALGSTIGLSAVVKAADGTIWRDSDGLPPKVVFYDFWNAIDNDEDKQYSKLATGMGDGKPVAWTPDAQGIYIVRAKAFLNNGTVLYSKHAGILVNRPAGYPSARLGSPFTGTVTPLSNLQNFFTEAQDEDGIANVTYYVNDNILGITTSPITAGGTMYKFDWQPSVAGVYKIYALVKDGAGNVSKTKTADVYVGVAPPVNQVPPVVNTQFPYLTKVLTYPVYYYPLGSKAYLGAVLRDANSAQWVEADNSVPRVKFYADDVYVAESAASGYIAEWAPTAAAAYTMTGISTLKNNQQIVSPPSTLLVGQPTAPRTQLMAPVYSGLSYRQGTLVPISVNATGMNGAGIAKVVFYANGEEIGTDTTAPYSLAWTPPVLGTYKIRAIATDTLGVTGLSAQREIRYIKADVASTADSLVSLPPPSLAALMASSENTFDGMATSYRVRLTNSVIPQNSVLELYEKPEQDFSWSNTPVATYDLQRNTIISMSAGISLSTGSSAAAVTFAFANKTQPNFGYRARICNTDTYNCSVFSSLLTVNVKILSSSSSSSSQAMSSAQSSSSSAASAVASASSNAGNNSSSSSLANTSGSSSSSSSLETVMWVYPAQGAPIPYVGSDPCFQWSKAGGATSYEIVLSSNANFSGEVWRKQAGLSESDCWNDGIGWSVNTSNTAPYKLTVGQTYNLKIIAYGSSGKTESAPRYFTLAKVAIPDAPVLNAPIQTVGSFQITWNPAANASADYYNIKEKNNGTVNFYKNITATNYTLNPQSYTVYEYSIQACNTIGCGPFSDVRRTMVNGVATLDSPSLVAPVDQTIISVSAANPCFQWNAVAGATGYAVAINTDGHFPISRLQRLNVTGTSICWNNGTDWVAAGLQPPTDKVLREGAVYYWRVTAVKGANESLGFSDTRRFRLTSSAATAPDAPIAISAQPNQASGTFNIRWRSVSDAVTYELQRAEAADAQAIYGAEWSASENYSSNNTIVSGFTSFTAYMWRVRACNAAKLCSDWKLSDPKVFQLPSAGTPVSLGQPPQYSIMGGNPCFDWVAPSQTTSTIVTLSLGDYFPAQRWSREVTSGSRVCWDGGLNWTSAGLTRLPVPTNLAVGLPYNWRVVSGNASGQQAFSETRTFVVDSVASTNPYLPVPSLNAEDVDADCFFNINLGAPANVPVDQIYELYERKQGQAGWQLVASSSRMYGNLPPFKLYSDVDIFKNRTLGGTYEYQARVCQGNECGRYSESLIVSTSYTCANIALPSVQFSPTISTAKLGQVTKLSVNASTTSGSIASVRFIAGGVVLGTVTTAPYTIDWTPDQLGNTNIEAIAEGSNGGTASTHLIVVNVTQTGQTVSSSGTTSSVISSGGGTSSGNSSASAFNFNADAPDSFKYSLSASGIPDLGGTQFVAATQGKLDVSNGAAQYSVAIDLPPAVRDLKPRLSLNYNSRGGNGLMGMGWSISGMSVISRCRASFALEGAEAQKSNPRYSVGDRLCLDGQKLVLADDSIAANDSNYWQNSAVYKTEIDNFSKITAYGTSPNGGHSYFKVSTKDGRVLTYGRAENSQNSLIRKPGVDAGPVSTWALDKVEDSYGNNYTITYEQDLANGDYHPLRINFAPGSAVVFSYQDRAGQVPWGYDMGSYYKHSKVLDKVTTYIGLVSESNPEAGTAVKQYDINYKLSNGTQRELVDTISECGYESGSLKCAKPLKFEWQAGEFGFESSPVALTYCGGSVKIPNVAEFYDIDSDGYVDAVHHSGEVSFGTKSGCFENGDWVVSGTATSRTVKVIRTAFGPALAVKELKNSQYSLYFIYDIKKSNLTKKVSAALVQQADKMETIAIGNFNNDGLDDFLFNSKKYTQSNDFTFTSTAVESTPLVEYVAAADGWKLGPVIPDVGGIQSYMDLDGDGLDDSIYDKITLNMKATLTSTNQWFYLDIKSSFKVILQSNYYDTLWIPGASPHTSIDINGDGHQDYLYHRHPNIMNIVTPITEPGSGSGTGYWYYRINMQNGELGPEVNTNVISEGEQVEHVHGSLSYDYDKDGRDDLIALTPESQVNCKTRVLLSRDKNGVFDLQEAKTASGDTLLIPGFSQLCSKFFGELGIAVSSDINNDGVRDLFSKDGVYFGKTQQPDLLKRVVDGFDAELKLDYSPLVDAENNGKPLYTPDVTAPTFPQVPVNRGMQVVKKVSATDGMGGYRDRFYNYAGGKTDIQGRGFLGFANIQITDVAADVVTSTDYYQTFPYTGKPDTRTVKNAAGDLITSTKYTYGVQGSNSRFVYLDYSLQKSYQLLSKDLSSPLSATKVDNTFDACGNLTEQKTETGTGVNAATISGLLGKQTVVNAVDKYEVGDCSDDFISKRTQTFSKTSDTDDVRTVVTDFTPTNKTNGMAKEILTTTEFSGTAQQKITTIARTAKGVVSGSSEEAKDLGNTTAATRELTSSDFEDDLFPNTITNKVASGDHVTTVGYNKKFGVETSITLPNLQQTTRGYDALGRLTSETSSDGSERKLITFYCANMTAVTCPIGAQYGVATRVTNTAAVGKLGEPLSIVYYDSLRREVRRSSYSLNGKSINVDTLYFADGRVQQTSEPFVIATGTETASYWSKFSGYDALGRAHVMENADGGKREIAFSVSGSLIKVTEDVTVKSPTTITTQTTQKYLNALGQVVQVVDAKSTPVDYTYNSLGGLNTTKVNNNDATLVTVDYDSQGNKNKIQDPDAGAIDFEYNGFGEMRRQTWQKDDTANKKSMTLSYDQLGRQTQRLDTPATNKGSPTTYTWVWDNTTERVKMGRLVSESGNGQTVTYHYDSHSRVDSQTTTITGLGDRVMTYGYDDFSRPNSVVYPNGFTISRDYHAAGMAVKTYDLTDAANPRVLWAMGNDVDGRGNFSKQLWGNGVVTQTVFGEKDGQLTGIKSGRLSATNNVDNLFGDIQALSYEYDSLGNVYSRSSNRTNGQGVAQELVREDYTYDSLNRLKTATTSGLFGRTNNYDYNELGNLTLRTSYMGTSTTNDDVGTLAYVPTTANNAGVHAVTSAGGKNYKYDKYGNMVERGLGSGAVETIDYDVFNKPTRINGASITTIDYDANHDRFREVSNGVASYSIAGGLYEEIVEGSKTTQKVYVDGVILNTKVLNGNVVTSNDTLYIHTDGQGSSEAISDRLGAFVTRMSFSDWGERQKSDSKTGTPTQLFATDNGYTGHHQLDQHKLVHMGGRVYDPELGRFLSADLFVQSPYSSQSFNRYSYGANNPMSRVDPSGYTDESVDEVVVTGTKGYDYSAIHWPNDMFYRSDSAMRAYTNTDISVAWGGGAQQDQSLDIGFWDNFWDGWGYAGLEYSGREGDMDPTGRDGWGFAMGYATVKLLNNGGSYVMGGTLRGLPGLPARSSGSPHFEGLSSVKPRSLNAVNPALGQFKLTANSIGNLVKGKPYIYVIDERNYLQVALRGSGGTSGVKHTQLTGGAPAKGAGELMLTDENTILLNNYSGRYRAQSPEAVTQVQKYLEKMDLDVKIVGYEF